ncbi:unnamed protein product [Malus baccata var. baccata]
MTLEQPELVSQVENHKLCSGTNEEIAASSDAFVAPEINSFGRSFRDYNAESERQKNMKEFCRMREKYKKLNRFKMSVWQCCELLNDVDKLDYNNPSYNTKCGIYSQGCGLENVTMSWRHDDYMYLVAKENGTTLPQAGSFIIRYHSFYPLHKAGAYKHLMNKEDEDNLIKSKDRIDVKKVKPYYLSLIDKYFPAQLAW